MERLIGKYINKLVEGGLTEKGAPILGLLDDDVVWNRNDQVNSVLEGLFRDLNISALLFSQPAEPYQSIIDYLARNTEGAIRPRDTETRTFFHELPVVPSFNSDAVGSALKKSKCAIIPGCGVVTYGTVSPEQAYITYSSVCFSCFVKFFADYLAYRKQDKYEKDREAVFEKAAEIAMAPDTKPSLAAGPFATEDEVLSAMEECGVRTVQYRLVDSYFGNISYLLNGTLYISQTSSSLDELKGVIDPCKLDGTSCAAITASSEFTTHREIVLNTDNRGVLHGHPKFPVILSMDCDRIESCTHTEVCHKQCPEERSIQDIPIVPGEVGTGVFGLCNTVPKAIENRRGVIVYGHGVFTVGKNDFREAFYNLMEIDRMCRQEYFERVR
jgi:ribulose-5-phosphate 4-epimerase/fuculose-1-phosphate aldolase